MGYCEFESSLSNELLKYIKAVVNIVKLSSEGIKLLEEFRTAEAMESFTKGIHEDTIADDVRRNLLIKLQDLHPGFMRERISTLLRRLDLIAEQSKEVSRNMTLFPYLELPGEIKNTINELSVKAYESVLKLYEITSLLINHRYDEVLEEAYRVELAEEDADRILVRGRQLLVKYGSVIRNPAIILMVDKLIEALEGITDFAEDASDYLRTLALYCRSV
ncbi:MAG: DUF47 domain-containing protein [Thermoprotei archaeon]